MIFRHHLIYRWVLVNALLIALAGAIAWTGYLLPVFEGDLTRLTYGIAALFVGSWAWCLKEIVVASRQLDASKRELEPAVPAQRNKDLAKVEWLERVAQWLAGLGLLGTVIGFSIALSGVDQDAVANASGAQGAVASLMQGMRIALNTTLLGAALAMWQEVNVSMLRTALECYWSDRIAAGAER